MLEPAHDAVKTPSHYRSANGVEVIDVIEAWGLGFHLGNAVKYILRAGHKDRREEDLAKACRYLSRSADVVEIAIFPSTFIEEPAYSPMSIAATFGLGWDLTYALTRIYRATRSETGPKAVQFLRDAKCALEREIGAPVDDWRVR